MTMDGKFSHGVTDDHLTASSGHPDHDACGTGFVVQLSGIASHEVVDRALTALQRLSHRGGVDADGASGDGAGLLTATPQRFLRRQAAALGIELPRCFGVGMLFITPESVVRVQDQIAALAPSMGLTCLGWREVPVNPSVPGVRAAETLPSVWQCFLAPRDNSGRCESKLFLFRKRAENEIGASVYFCSLSSRTIVYKGLLAPWQLPLFYPDLWEHDFETSFAIFHQRFSTNTQPAWSLAQPFRFLGHNGEINTITGNRRWMRARETEVRSRLRAGHWFKTLEENVSDSASLDNAVEILVQQGRSLEAALMSLVPPVTNNNPRLNAELEDYLECSAWEYEPWDGPAALIFSDGRTVGAKLDRNGLRPLRYTRTSDGWLIAGSESGLADFDENTIVERQRLGPGEMLAVDIPTGRITRNGATLAHSWPVAVSRQSRSVTRISPTLSAELIFRAEEAPRKIASAMGWTEDQIKFLLQPLAEGKEGMFSMGDDTPPAFMSKLRRTLWDYCKQRFAQVTNPPIDPLRESHVMSLETCIGESVIAPSPILGERQIAQLEATLAPCLRIDITFSGVQGNAGGIEALEQIRNAVRWEPGNVPKLVVLSDRNVSHDRVALPAMLVAAAVWQDMARAGHFRVPLIVETAQVLDTHHVAMLLAVGVTCVRPYLALQIASEMQTDGAANYARGIGAGLKKVLSRMGISTLASYRNAQLFEVIGLDGKLCHSFFTDAPRVAEATSISQLLEDYLYNHALAYAADHKAPRDAGLYRFRKEGEIHQTSPDLMRRIQALVKNPGDESYRVYEELSEQREPTAIRDLLTVAYPENPATVNVESQQQIIQRFSVQAMSVGAISPEAHQTLALAMNRLGARSNTGEGGDDPGLYDHQPEAASRIKQVASARFGVTVDYLVHAQEIEIKMAQGSKPGEGGQLPANKVTPYIAKLRRAVPGMSLISPPPHHDIYSIEDLEQLIHDLRQVNPRARIGVKLVAGAGVGIIAAGVAKAGADVITISGHDGGTGASPLSSIKNTGLPWEFGLRDAHRTLVESGLRRHVRLRVDGGLKFARDLMIAALLGADEFGFGTAALLAIGCVMARQCHLNTCPVGIATQDEKLRTRFSGKPEMVIAFMQGIAAEFQSMLQKLGAGSVAEIVGRTELLRPRYVESDAWVDGLLRPPSRAPETRSVVRMRKGLSHQLMESLKISGGARSREFTVTNADRSIGAELSGELSRRYGAIMGRSGISRSAPLQLRFKGVAGQSFGAFLMSGVSFQLEGEANDYVGKGLSGGTISIDCGANASLRRDVLAGNTVLYGATSGELYVAGRAGERFAVRNSGALAVVEGVGDHGCEYMTGGVVLVLGPSGINFGSGMTGGLAYVLAQHATQKTCNLDFVTVAPCTPEEDRALREVLLKHCLLTGSPHAAALLNAGPLLPLLRVQPVQLPCAIETTWAPILQRLQNPISALHAKTVDQHFDSAIAPRPASIGMTLEIDPDHLTATC
jgi:glutamate synthase (ferredoxin)